MLGIRSDESRWSTVATPKGTSQKKKIYCSNRDLRRARMNHRAVLYLRLNSISVQLFYSPFRSPLSFYNPKFKDVGMLFKMSIKTQTTHILFTIQHRKYIKCLNLLNYNHFWICCQQDISKTFERGQEKAEKVIGTAKNSSGNIFQLVSLIGNYKVGIKRES